MVKKINAEVKADAQAESQVAELQAEITRLKAENDKHLQQFLSTSSKSVVDEIEQLRKSATRSRSITVKENADHKNVSLWTPWGKRIGPMHPDNLEYVYKLWRANNKVILRAKQPTPDELQAYNESPEGKARLEAEKANRARKQKTLKKMDQLIKLIADSVGGNIEKLKYDASH